MRTGNHRMLIFPTEPPQNQAMPEFQLISLDQAADVGEQLLRQERIGIDTEFMRESTYFPQLCLIQVAIDEQLFCIDPLDSASPGGFWDALHAPQWVLHSGRQDLEVMSQVAGQLPARVFDTQIAAALLGYAPQLGYANLVADLFDVQLAKTQTRADWSRRPLAPAALDYAAEDVEHLLPAADALTDRLKAAGRLDWALADCADLLDPALYRIDPENAVDRIKGARALSGHARSAAVALADWRERKAHTTNRPRQWILRDAVLLDIAASAPSSKAEIAAIRDLPASTARRHAEEFLAILEAARTSEDGYQPPGRPDEKQKAAMKAMQKKVASCAKELDIAAEVIAPRRELAAALQGDLSGRVFRGWRRELIGDDLLELVDD